MRALADGREMPAREAPTVMLPSSTMAANRRKSVRSKCTAQVLDALPFCLWRRQRQGYENPSLHLFEPTDNSVGMSNPITHLVVLAAAFLLAGLVKGVTGLALPTVGGGLLSLAMPAPHAAALIVVPALITNIWQMMSGPGLGSLVRRLWPMQLAICLGTWANASLMAGSETAFASAALGIALIAYAAFGLMSVRVPQCRLGPNGGWALLSEAQRDSLPPLPACLQYPQCHTFRRYASSAKSSCR